MRNELRFVLDTNVILSALLSPRSTTRESLEHATGLGRLLISEPLAAEFREVMRRKKFDKYLSEERRLDFLAKLTLGALLVEISRPIRECRDPKDDKILELAVEGDATCIVTGDDDLLTLDPFRGIPIVTPREFLDRPWLDPTH